MQSSATSPMIADEMTSKRQHAQGEARCNGNRFHKINFTRDLIEKKDRVNAKMHENQRCKQDYL
jgi:hypothetical protein